MRKIADELVVPKGKVVAMDVETDSTDYDSRLSLIQVSDGKTTQLVRPENADPDVIHTIFSEKEVLGFNFQFDLYKLACYYKEFFHPVRLWDLRSLSIMEWPAQPANLQDCCARIGIVISKELQGSSWGLDLTQEQLEYAATDVEVLHKLFKHLEPRANTSYGRLEGDFAVTAAYMTWCGIPVDLERLNKLRAEYQAEFDAVNVWLRDGLLFPVPLNHNSHVQVKQYVLDKYGVQLKSTEVDSVREVMRTCEPALKEDLATILKKRNIEKSIQYLDGLLRYRTDKGRVHPRYSPLVRTGAGRTSCKEPNAQNPPSAYASSDIRSVFHMPQGFFYFDLPNIHGRIAAELSRDPVLVRVFREGLDLHSLTGSRISYLFDVDAKWEVYENFVQGKKTDPKVSRIRETGKAVFYGSLNGQGIGGVMRTLASGGIAVDKPTLRSILKEFSGLYVVLSKFIKHLGSSEVLHFRDGFEMNVAGQSFNERVSRSWLHYEAVIIKHILNKVRKNVPDVEINNLMHDSAMFSIKPGSCMKEEEFRNIVGGYYNEVMHWFFKVLPVPEIELKLVKEMPA